LIDCLWADGEFTRRREDVMHVAAESA
jgi:hypothetical protein